MGLEGKSRERKHFFFFIRGYSASAWGGYETCGKGGNVSDWTASNDLSCCCWILEGRPVEMPDC